jgi:hypothetical protein
MKKIFIITILILCTVSQLFSEQGVKQTGTSKQRTNNYLSIETGCGLTIPVGYFAPALNMAITPVAAIGYNLSFHWGILGFGLYSGCNIAGTSTEATYQSTLFSIPAAAQVRYQTNFNSRFYGFVEANGGIAVNILAYKENYPGLSNSTSVTPFVAPGLGVGFRVLKWLSVSAYGNYMMLFFEDGLYMGISPGLRVGFKV